VSLRQLVAARFPLRPRTPAALVPSGVRSIDEPLGGGLPAGRLTELVSGAPSSGGQSVLAALLLSTRSARRRVALVDGADGFDPRALPEDSLRHLVWARCADAEGALAAADILVRDVNYAALVLDLRGLRERALRQLPAAGWHRLQRAAEHGAAAVLVQTPFPLVPAVPLRLSLDSPLALATCRLARSDLIARMPASLVRGHAEETRELAG